MTVNRVSLFTKSIAVTPLIIALAVALSSASIKADDKNPQSINVLSSIKPIQLIATAIVGDLGHSNLLLPPSANPHHYQLRPSQRARLSNADLFIWVGPELELFLVKVLQSSGVNQLPLTAALKLQQDSTENHSSRRDTLEHHEHSHNHENGYTSAFDPHIWLNPAYTRSIAESIYNELSTHYPAHQIRLRENTDTFLARLKTSEEQITKQFTAQSQIDIYTFHHAFSYFADYFGMTISGTITLTPESRPGAKHLAQLASEISNKKSICLIKEPNFKAPYVETITQGTDVKVITADPLATAMVNSETGYIEFIHAIADSFSQCLK